MPILSATPTLLYSQAIPAGNTLYISGQLPVNPETKEIPEGITAQTEQVMQHIKAILDEAGFTFDDVVKSIRKLVSR